MQSTKGLIHIQITDVVSVSCYARVLLTFNFLITDHSVSRSINTSAHTHTHFLTFSYSSLH